MPEEAEPSVRVPRVVAVGGGAGRRGAAAVPVPVSLRRRMEKGSEDVILTIQQLTCGLHLQSKSLSSSVTISAASKQWGETADSCTSAAVCNYLLKTDQLHLRVFGFKKTVCMTCSKVHAYLKPQCLNSTLCVCIIVWCMTMYDFTQPALPYYWSIGCIAVLT